MASVTPVKIACRGKTCTMRTRPKETDRDRVIFQTDHLAGLTLVQCLLHTGTVQRQSKVLLVIEIQAETYEPALPPP